METSAIAFGRVGAPDRRSFSFAGSPCPSNREPHSTLGNRPGLRLRSWFAPALRANLSGQFTHYASSCSLGFSPCCPQEPVRALLNHAGRHFYPVIEISRTRLLGSRGASHRQASYAYILAAFYASPAAVLPAVKTANRSVHATPAHWCFSRI